MLQPAFASLDKESKRVMAQNTIIESLLKEREQLLDLTAQYIAGDTDARTRLEALLATGMPLQN